MRLWLPLLFSIAVSGWADTRYDWIQKVGSGSDLFVGLAADASGNSYIVGNTTSAAFPVNAAVQPALASPGMHDVFVVKLDSGGNVVYATYFGGTGDDVASAMTVDAAGNVYVTGLTYSSDFPVSANAFLKTPPSTGSYGYQGASFVFKLNPSGGLGYSTYFAPSESNPHSIAVGADGSAYVTGFTGGGLPVTPGAYSSTCNCGITSNGFFGVITQDGFLARISPGGDKLIFSTYLNTATGIGMTTGQAIAVAADGSAYVAATPGVYWFDAAGASLLGKTTVNVTIQTMTMAQDGSLYVAGPEMRGFAPAASAAQKAQNLLPMLGSQPQMPFQLAIAHVDANLKGVLAATYLGGPYYAQILSLAVTPAGDLLVGGATAPHGWPTAAPLAQGFGPSSTGLAARLTGDLTAVQFSSYFGDNENFKLGSVAAEPDGSLILGGSTLTQSGAPPAGTVWVNRVTIGSAPPLRIDSVANAASRLDDPLSGGETIRVRGSGFAAGAQVTVGGRAIDPLSLSAQEIVAVLPADLPAGAAAVQVTSGGSISNSVLAPVATAAPGLFSTDGTGTGQGYILNQDGTLNSAANPANPGDKITVYATGIGPVTFDNGFAVTATPVSLYLDGFYCKGVAAVMRDVDGFPGDVYQLTVYVPSYADIVAINPDLKTFKYAPQVGVILRIAGGQSQNGLALSIAQ